MNDMTYDAFLIAVCDAVRLHFGAEDEIGISKIRKNNGVILDALIIRRAGRRVSPTIYLRRFYEELLQGTDFGEIIDTILYIEKNCEFQAMIDLDDFGNYERMKSHIFLKLINTKRNEDLLKEIPHREFMDLSIVYYLLCDSSKDNFASATIREEHMKKWGVEEAQIYALAKYNTLLHYPVEVSGMYDVLKDMIPEGKDSDMEESLKALAEEERMFVVTNSTKMFGSVALLFDEFLKSFAKIYGSFYILPSSIHELIFVADRGDLHEKELQEMVRTVNASELPEDEILSDYVYYYHQEDNGISILKDDIE